MRELFNIANAARLIRAELRDLNDFKIFNVRSLCLTRGVFIKCIFRELPARRTHRFPVAVAAVPAAAPHARATQFAVA